MPLNYDDVWKKLTDKLSDFKAFKKDAADELNTLNKIVPQVFSQDYDALISQLKPDPSKITNNGAYPTEEYKQGLIIPFSKRFSNYQDMLSWACGIMKDKMIMASDGSQIYPTKDYTMPVGLVHIAYYINEFKPERKYEKATVLEILSPNELELTDGDTIIDNEAVNIKRFESEFKILDEKMTEYAKRTPRPCFGMFIFDGSLIVSFAGKLEFTRPRYLNSVHLSVKNSALTQFPLVGYIDSSAAKDVGNMILTLSGSKEPIRYNSDASIIQHYCDKQGQKLELGDRTCVFIADRNDPVYASYPSKVGQKIAFFYIKLNDENPSRVEFPEWIIQYPDLLQQITESIVVDAISGLGYPYSTDESHHNAVIPHQDAQKFFYVMQEFSKKNGLDFKIRTKTASKLRR